MLKKFSLLIIFFVLSNYSSADEFDGGIRIDEPITDKLDISFNIPYLVRKAKAAIETGKINTGCGGAGNQTFGPGSHLNNATIINYSDNKGAISLCEK